MAWSVEQLGLLPRSDLIPVNQSDDPRVGSGRDNSTGGTLSHVGTNSSSLASLGSTFVPVLIYSAICLLIFIALRPRCPRVYSPKAVSGIEAPADQIAPLPSGWFGWVKTFYHTPETHILNHCSLDGFFFLRFLRVLCIICLAGVCFAWPILLPIHGTGGRQLEQLDLLTIGNVANGTKFYAHVVVSWCFFGFILFMISRECIYYINLRQAYLLSPKLAHRLSSRTVLFTCVPPRYLDERRIKKLFGDSVRNVWIPKNTKVLRELVKEREETAQRLEKAEIELIKMANASRSKQLKSQPQGALHEGGSEPVSPAITDASTFHPGRKSSVGHNAGDDFRVSSRSLSSSELSPSTAVHRGSSDEKSAEKHVDPEYTHPYGLNPSLPDVNGSVAALYIPQESRPTHRPLANLGRSVDTIKWTRSRLKILNAQIAKLRRRHRAGHGISMSAVFVEFDSQADAQAAFQTLAHHQPLHMSPRFIGIRPGEIVWSALRMKWWERIIRRFLVMGAIAAGVIFWSIPSALVGMISNLKYLSEKIPFLGWIEELPSIITGVIQGLLPALALSLLMAIVPVLVRACARFAGVPSLAMIELFTQSAYFVFQVVQVFLVTTLTSAASAAFTDILKDPLSAKDLLSQNLPKASNFYLSYILVQCLAAGAGGFLQLLQLFRHQIIGKVADNPRTRFKRWHKLPIVHWGSVYPVFTNLGVIAISYSCIAPLVLVFSGLGMCFTYVMYRYNLIYVYDTQTLDAKGLFYPRALMHLLTGLYLAEICLIGLFALQFAFAPLILMVMFLVFTGLVHISLNDAVSPLLYNLPRTLALENKEVEDIEGEQEPHDVLGSDGPATAESNPGGAAADYYDPEEAFGEEEDMDTMTTSRGIEGGRGFMSSISDWTKAALMAEVKAEAEDSGVPRLLAKWNKWTTPDPNKKPNFIMRWLHPEIFEDFRFLRRMVDQGEPAPGEPEDRDLRQCYWPPEMWMPAPQLWIPRDDARVSRQEVAHTSKVVSISDGGAWLDEKGRMVVDLDAAPYHNERAIYRML
ncbi:DUF221 domain-containing protein [Pleurostoma richardsiae]|uniref:DUF221 domain-containing protein n=1 Tax=Pleurostoma richardsiae TaxID=41990 RepID=A0AA38S4P7_9PEZI|nr:DUF221 domain-containing protein [Pleurostoma richardsiae]